MKLVESNSGPAHPPQWDAFVRLVNLALNRALASDSAVTAALRKQRAHVHIVQIDYTGHGFFAQLRVGDENCPRAELSGMTDSGSFAEPSSSEALDDLIGTIVYVEDGILDCVEAFGNPDWPADVSRHELVDLG